MLSEVSLLVRLLSLIDKIPAPPPPAKRPRGKPPKYSDKLMLKALIVMIIRRPHKDGGVEVRRIFHKLRSQSIELFNGLFKDVFGWSKNMPVKGLRPRPDITPYRSAKAVARSASGRPVLKR